MSEQDFETKVVDGVTCYKLPEDTIWQTDGVKEGES